MGARKTFLSIIVPVYNEAERILNLNIIHEFLKKQKFKSELIIVNDGSSDATLRKIKFLTRSIKIKLITYDENMGKGYAVRKGMLAASGKYRLFTDVDLSTPMEELYKFMPFIKKYDVLIGSRKVRGADVIKHQPFVRESLGKGFTKLSSLILNIKVSDFTCGFKCFSQKAAKEIFSKGKISRWGFDSEILFIAKYKGFTIKEIPVKWSDDNKTKVNFPYDLVNSFSELLQIKYNQIKKFYE